MQWWLINLPLSLSLLPSLSARETEKRVYAATSSLVVAANARLL